MNTRAYLAATAALAILGVAGQVRGQEDEATAAAERDAKEATSMATPSASEMGFGNSGGSSSGSSHTESHSSSTSVSVTFGAAQPGPPPGWGAGPRPISGAALNGVWKLASADGSRSCGLRLSDGNDTDEPHYAWTETGGPDGTLGVNRWRYDGRRLTLSSGIGDTFAEFRRVGANRFEGQNVKSGERLVISR